MGRTGFSKFRSRWWAFCEIHRQIQRGRACTPRSLAADLEVDPRTVRRYISFMREELGAPIHYDPIDERYTLTEATWTMPNVHLSDHEMVALAISLRAMNAVAAEPFIASLNTLFQKLLDAIPVNRRNEILSLQERVDIVPAAVPSVGEAWIGALLKAVSDCTSVKIDYYVLSRDRLSHRVVDPYHLRFFGGCWYLIGLDHETKHFPVFSLARIRGLSACVQTFKRQEFTAATFFKNSFGISVGGELKTVRVRLTGRAARTASERVWPDGFSYKSDANNNSGILTGKIGNPDDLLHWIGSQRGDAELLSD